MKAELKRAVPMAEAFSKLLHPFAEVVIHDLEKDRIEAIYNPLSQRQVGDRSYLDLLEFTVNSADNVIGPYEKMNYDGRKLKSISVILRNESGTPEGFLCVNTDISIFERYQESMLLFLNNNDRTISQKNHLLFKDDLYEQINIFVQDYCQKHYLSLENLTRKDKRSVILKLKKNGAFNGKNATDYISRILNISRATVYNYLKTNEEGA